MQTAVIDGDGVALLDEGADDPVPDEPGAGDDENVLQQR